LIANERKDSELSVKSSYLKLNSNREDTTEFVREALEKFRFINFFKISQERWWVSGKMNESLTQQKYKLAFLNN